MNRNLLLKCLSIFVFCAYLSIVSSLKALDFSLDNDWKADENNSYTHASLQKENLPSSFTICTTFMVEAWTKYQNTWLFVLNDDKGEIWHWVKIYADQTFALFQFQFEDSLKFTAKTTSPFYPLQWTRVCLSSNSNTSLVRLVVDGELLMETGWKVNNKPDNLNLVLGLWKKSKEQTGRTTNLNIFSSALPVEQMKLQTSAGVEECGLQGDYISWEKSFEEEQWTIHSKARLVNLDGGLESPCMAKGKINVFPMIERHSHTDCMDHCKKLGGRSPSVRTEGEWENLSSEVRDLSPDPSRLPDWIWLSATEGYIKNELGELEHWPDGTKAVEGVWRDYYTGEQLENYTKPWRSSNGDREVGDTFNCIYFYPTSAEVRTWKEWQCSGFTRGCPCTYETPPVIHLRGFCPNTLVEHGRYTISQSATDPTNIIIVGQQSARIEYDSLLNEWILSDPRLNVTARTRASQISYALGKHNWTIEGDRYPCSAEGKDYDIQMKLTGCKADEFTCDDGQCIKMEERCDQMPQCGDESDEQNCKILVLQHGYNKEVPPIAMAGRKKQEKKLLPVKVSLTLQKVIAIEEVDYSISFKFKISLMWRENRVTYQNLKTDSTNNLLRQDEVRMLWLPLVFYWNTDQEETTRLGEPWEWKTRVMVQREGNFTRNSMDRIDEAEIFEGAENSLLMEQTYTHDFQCVFKLDEYPFDTQVLNCFLVVGYHFPFKGMPD